MEPLCVDICYKSILNNVVDKLKIRKYGYGYEVDGLELFKAYVEIELNIDSTFKTRVFWAVPSKHKIESEQDAAKETVDYLQMKCKFEVCDVNFSNFQYYKWCYHRINGGFDKTLEENKALKEELSNLGILVLQNMFANNVELLFGAKVDNTINVGGGPYIYRISGQNHHLMGSLLLATGEKPKFAQLYIYDTENEVMNRLQSLSRDNTLSSRLEFDIVSELVKMFDECNDLAKVFRMARDRFRALEFIPIRLRLMRSHYNDSNVYNLPTGSEVAALIVGDLDDNVMRDVIVEHKSDGLQRISELHPSFMAMQYPLLFPYGEDGFQLGIKYITNDGKRKTKR
ncbi:hypothetical protein LWI29_004385 [Acer saccharum]|uniref:Uncharacterized protein n=1 Tax=Acer saccharum TaxID=4024 RepID=A0AA39W5I7_ACESA|nr:hypothetical protein LWI29_004385 [Acer saccharum]